VGKGCEAGKGDVRQRLAYSGIKILCPLLLSTSAVLDSHIEGENLHFIILEPDHLACLSQRA